MFQSPGEAISMDERTPATSPALGESRDHPAHSLGRAILGGHRCMLLEADHKRQNHLK